MYASEQGELEKSVGWYDIVDDTEQPIWQLQNTNAERRSELPVELQTGFLTTLYYESQLAHELQRLLRSFDEASNNPNT
jgi:hypothetical protein